MSAVRSAVLISVLAACGGDDSMSMTMADAPTVMPDMQVISMTTALTATMAATRTLDRAFYGVNADTTLHVEINKGGDTGCPQMTSPTPEYTQIIGKVPAMTAANATSTANFLDYQGDMLPSPMLGQAATSVNLTSVVYQVGMFVALDAQLTFPAGTVNGHVYAIHCTSLDD